jgi:alpha-beta hydrolase superfamily lysophospholipase
MSDADKSPAELRSEIEETREQLGGTVEQLAAKADVKARVHDDLEQRREAVKEKAAAGVEEARRKPYIPIAVGVGAAVLVLVVLRRRS